MGIKRTDDNLIKDIEILNKQAKMLEPQESRIIYTGIYEILDEIVKRIKKVELIDSVYVDKYADIFIKVYRELKEGKQDE